MKAVWGILTVAALAARSLPPERYEDWRYNARERTAATRKAFEEERHEDALQSARSAYRLDPEEPVTELNLGTAHLAAGQREEALDLLSRVADRLEAALETEPGAGLRDLAAAAHYNRAQALAQGQDWAGAVAAYEQALRREPDHQDAKFNLELALAELARQQQEQQGDQGGGGEQEQPAAEPEQTPQPSPGGGEEQSPPETGEPRSQDGDPTGRDPRLPRFEPQPDMTAEEAAAILEAVENLERQERRQQALERARSTARREKDW